MNSSIIILHPVFNQIRGWIKLVEMSLEENETLLDRGYEVIEQFDVFGETYVYLNKI